MAQLRITEAELLDALATAGAEPSDAKTVQELADDAGLSQPRVRKALRLLHRAGRLGIHRVQRADLSGRVQLVPAYTIAKV